MDIEKLIHKAITSDDVDKAEISEIIAKYLNENSDSKDIYMNIYDNVFGDTLCKDECETWVESMSGGDEYGQKWTIEEVFEIANRIGIEFDKITKYELWASTHYEYYTHKDSLKKSGIPVDNVLFVRFGYDFANANDFNLKNVYFNIVKDE